MPDDIKDTVHEDIKELLREYEENPFDPTRKTPEDIMHIFYKTNLPIVPVISKRNLLIGIITKEAVTAEMSDLDRFSNIKIDQFIEKIARKMTLDEIIPFLSTHREFITINLFGEIQATWSRLDLLAACENNNMTQKVMTSEIQRHKEEQALEWMIYLILEHIPRALYAMNNKGKTIFYNSFFEDLYLEHMQQKDVDVRFLEKSLSNHKMNEFFYKKNQKDMYFYNKEIKFYYEKIPMISNDQEVGYLIYCLHEQGDASHMNEFDMSGGVTLQEHLHSIERAILVEAIKFNNNDLEKVGKSLKIQKKTLLNKIKKHNIKV